VSLLSVLIVAHAVSGAVALLSMGVPLASRKGSPRHRKAGRVYTPAMAGVVVLATVVAGARLLDDAPGNDGMSTFLILVAVLAGDTTWFGWMTAREQQSAPSLGHRAFPAAIAGLGGLAVVRGLRGGGPLPLAFGVLTAFVAGSQVRALRGGWPTGKARIREHIASYIPSCIATTTAFLVVNAANLPPAVREAVPGIVVWLAPTVLLTPAIFWFQRRYAD
jgi:UDP-N-acetylmuramyl pentapeptide phosphotransferase/UDP-N-acetylglucosamine-1-phosphate transferase